MRLRRLTSVSENYLLAFLQRLVRVVNGNLTFGNGTDLDNIKGRWVTFESSNVPGEENEITHNTGFVPIGILVMKPPASGTLNMGATSWTISDVYLTCSAASQTVTIFVLVP